MYSEEISLSEVGFRTGYSCRLMNFHMGSSHLSRHTHTHTQTLAYCPPMKWYMMKKPVYYLFSPPAHMYTHHMHTITYTHTYLILHGTDQSPELSLYRRTWHLLQTHTHTPFNTSGYNIHVYTNTNTSLTQKLGDE